MTGLTKESTEQPVGGGACRVTFNQPPHPFFGLVRLVPRDQCIDPEKLAGNRIARSRGRPIIGLGRFPARTLRHQQGGHPGMGSGVSGVQRDRSVIGGKGRAAVSHRLESRPEMIMGGGEIRPQGERAREPRDRFGRAATVQIRQPEIAVHRRVKRRERGRLQQRRDRLLVFAGPQQARRRLNGVLRRNGRRRKDRWVFPCGRPGDSAAEFVLCVRCRMGRGRCGPASRLRRRPTVVVEVP
jgi:hypothetical protein